MDFQGSHPKAARKGMHLNPRDIVLDEEEMKNKIPIENSIFQLENLSNEEYQITLAWGHDVDPIRSPRTICLMQPGKR